MKQAIKVLAILAVLLITFSSQTSARAEADRVKESYTEAYFVTIDASGCIHTEVMVFTGQEILYALSMIQWNGCTGQVLQEAYAHFQPMSKTELKYFGDLQSARLDTTVQATDPWTGSSVDIVVDLTWTGSSDVYTYHEHTNRELWPGCRVNLQDRSRSRIALATGTVSIGATNFTPEPSTAASILLLNNVEISHGCE